MIIKNDYANVLNLAWS